MSVCGPTPPNVLGLEHTAAIWLAAGGDPNAIVPMTATAEAESGFDASAESCAGAIGLWQILPIHVQNTPYTVEDLYNPLYNATFAVILSQNGQQYAPWDSCYQNLDQAAQRFPISYPMQGSPAYNFIPEVASALGVSGGGGSGMPVNTGNPPPSGQQPTTGYTPTYDPTQYNPPPPGQGTGQLPPYQGVPTAYVPPANGYGWDEIKQFIEQDSQELANTATELVAQIGINVGGS